MNDLALDYFNTALKLDSTNLDVYYSKAKYLQDKGLSKNSHDMLNRSIETYKKIIKKDRNYAQAYYNVGYIYNEIDSLDNAYRYFDLAIKVSPTYADAYYSRGLVAERQGLEDKAIIDYKQALNLDPEHRLALKAIEEIKNNK
jgi:tetratricopeptide (TPR) repeat protein